MTKDIGVFGRLGWNDGKTESFAFTAIDRLATAGVSVNGHALAPAQRRGGDANLPSADSPPSTRSIWPCGGYDFLIGDGALRYGPETIWESYYGARLFSGVLRDRRLQPRR